ncbi:hypothetical protein [Succinivibrio dextrinosolvens]|uniref:hypothetical protein n=1 Tax=Succinivibrio dextrinosolvens TaxID=83771 RepID=UPI00241DA39B|nr:hypothetical protein [Succinivibrio dextrinosolvens]MBE6422915.1 hypothetical protein [Succinivibrio dextrinosolvens]
MDNERKEEIKLFLDRVMDFIKSSKKDLSLNYRKSMSNLSLMEYYDTCSELDKTAQKFCRKLKAFLMSSEFAELPSQMQKKAQSTGQNLRALRNEISNEKFKCRELILSLLFMAIDAEGFDENTTDSEIEQLNSFCSSYGNPKGKPVVLPCDVDYNDKAKAIKFIDRNELIDSSLEDDNEDLKEGA